MNIKQLRAELSRYPDEMPVILSVDSEGNQGSPLSETTEGWYEPECPWKGDIVHEDDYDPEERPEAERVLFLWPEN